MKIKFKKLDPLDTIPVRKHPTDSGMDICATESRILGYLWATPSQLSAEADYAAHEEARLAQ